MKPSQPSTALNVGKICLALYHATNAETLRTQLPTARTFSPLLSTAAKPCYLHTRYSRRPKCGVSSPCHATALTRQGRSHHARVRLRKRRHLAPRYHSQEAFTYLAIIAAVYHAVFGSVSARAWFRAELRHWLRGGSGGVHSGWGRVEYGVERGAVSWNRRAVIGRLWCEGSLELALRAFTT
jgi:hypothetical protein